MPRSPLQSIDLFAGCGGLGTGLHLAGWKGLFAVGSVPQKRESDESPAPRQRIIFSYLP